MKHRWDSCNKWLHLGEKERWVVQFDQWLNWLPMNKLTVRTWSLFSITWDNGAWWGLDLDNALILDNKKYGKLNGFLEVTVFGIGIRRDYSKKVTASYGK